MPVTMFCIRLYYKPAAIYQKLAAADSIRRVEIAGVRPLSEVSWLNSGLN
jgi:hypothetical protein